MRIKSSHWFYILIVVIIVFGCASEKGDWQKAKSENTIQAYEEFLKKYPQGILADSASLLIDKISFNNAKSENTIQAYEEFLKKYPQSIYVEEAYRIFIEKYPYNEFTQQAKKRLEEIEYEKVKSENTIEAYTKFIKEHSDYNFIKVESLKPTQLPRGKITKIIVVTEKIDSIPDVIINPAKGISVNEVKELESTKGDKVEKKRWSIVLNVDKASKVGERELILVTPKSCSKINTIVIPTPPHAPRISDLKVLSAKSYETEVEFTFTVFDEVGDVDDDSHVTVMLTDSDGRWEIRFRSPWDVTQKNSNTFIVHDKSSTYGARASGLLELEVSFQCSGGYKSNSLKTMVEFKD